MRRRAQVQREQQGGDGRDRDDQDVRHEDRDLLVNALSMVRLSNEGIDDVEQVGLGVELIEQRVHDLLILFRVGLQL
eukprot:753242-Hanusia_phi.AAC.7